MLFACNRANLPARGIGEEIYTYIYKGGPLAQLAEQLTLNQ
ncbi:hypothetical protein NITGR_360039 [Nitrospina gracilis 3/211]|uniref:Uncharacterized protein n=1 Tax=Nitrospina gracilis (strain 3/211) TaxID=1266370 RepID=M1YZM2_NITG3|nr:hypothetical protein NITGR_360039 [Nitrospina gracilis 3/211]